MLAAHIVASRGRRSERLYRSIGIHALDINKGWTTCRVSLTILLERHTTHESTLRSLNLVQQVPLVAADHFNRKDLGRVRSGHDKRIGAVNVLFELRLEMLFGSRSASISIKRDLEHLIVEQFRNWSRIG